MISGFSKPRQIRQEDIKIVQDYVCFLSKPIGKGNFSQVFFGTHKHSGKQVAIKIIKHSSINSKIAEQLLKSEVSLLKELNHENILKCYEVFSSKNNCYIVTDFYEFGDLQKQLHRRKKFKELEISKIVYNIYQGLLYLNSKSIIHRDLKVANVFINKNRTFKIADFGFAVKSSEPFKDIKIGSPIYMSPEGLLLNEYGPKTDIWSFGILMYELVHGDTPLSCCRSQSQLKQHVLLPPKYSQQISEELKELINACLTVDSRYRPHINSLSQFSYIRKILYQFQPKMPKQLQSTTHQSILTNSNHLISIVSLIVCYDQGYAIVQYCRLIHKTCQKFPSRLLSQWLLNVSQRLQEIRLEVAYEKNQTLLKIVGQYYLKYQKQHKNSGIELTFEEVIKECKRLGSDIQHPAHAYLRLLMKETQMLMKEGSNRKLMNYAKNSQIDFFLESKQNNLPK